MQRPQVSYKALHCKEIINFILPISPWFEFVAEWFKFSCNKLVSELQLELRVCHWCNKLRGPCQVVRRMRTVHSFYYGATGPELLAVNMLSASTSKSWGDDFSASWAESIYFLKKSFRLLCYINIFLRGNNTDDQTTALCVKGQTMKKTYWSKTLILNNYNTSIIKSLITDYCPMVPK